MFHQSSLPVTSEGSKDKEFVPYFRTLRKTVAGIANFTRRQRLCKSTFDSLRVLLDTTESVLENSDTIRGIFRKENKNADLSDEQENLLKNLLEIEANIPKLHRILVSLLYSADGDGGDKVRMSRKFISLYEAPHKYRSLRALYRRLKGALHNIAADSEVSAEDGHLFESFFELDDSEMEEKDANKLGEKLGNHLGYMAENRFFTNDSLRGKQQLEKNAIDSSSMDTIVQYLSDSPHLRGLRKNLLVEVFKAGVRTKVQIIENTMDNFKEFYLGYHELDLEVLYNIEKHMEYTQRFQKPYIASCFGYFSDMENRGFQLCIRQPEVTLTEYMRDSDDFSAEIVFKFIVQIIDAIKFSHEVLEAVGDLRPENILVKDGSKPQLVLLSVVTDIRRESKPDELLERARYQAPELLVGHDDHSFVRKTKAADVYAIGMLLWEMMQKKKPYASVDDFEHLIELKSKGSHPSKLLEEEEDLIEHLEYHELLDTFFAEVWFINPLRRPIPKKLVKKTSLKKILKMFTS